MVGKKAAEHGVVAAVRYYIKQFPNLKENILKKIYHVHVRA